MHELSSSLLLSKTAAAACFQVGIVHAVVVVRLADVVFGTAAGAIVDGVCGVALTFISGERID